MIVRSASSWMAERPDVGRNGVEVGLRKGDTTHRRHGAGMGLGLRHAILDRRFEALQASVAPQPFPIGQIWSDRRSLGIRAMTAAAGSTRNLAMENAVSERNLLLGETLGHRESAGVLPSVGMDAFRRQSIGRGGRLRDAWGHWRRRHRGFKVAALIADAPNSSVHIIRDKERAVRS